MNREKRLRNAVVLIGLMVALLVSLTGFGPSLHEPLLMNTRARPATSVRWGVRKNLPRNPEKFLKSSEGKPPLHK